MQRLSKNELENRVDEVLFYIWDPIGINDTPQARAEYRSYVTSILDHVVHQKSQEQIADLLCGIESGSMGLAPNRQKTLDVAALLIEHKEAIDEGLA